MKKFKVLAIITIAVTLNSSITFAHSGRTDSNGGHYNRKTGEYHYHNGGSATKSSSSSTSSSTSSSSKNTSTSTKTTAKSSVRYTNLTVNGENVNLDTKPFIDENGRTMVPIAKIAEIFNATTEFDATTNTVTIKDADTTIVVVIGEKLC